MSTQRRGGLGKGLGALIATSGGRTEADDPTADATQAAPEQDLDDAPSAPEPADQSAPTPPVAPPVMPPASPIGISGIRLIEVDPTTVARNPRQPRDVFDQE
ncbi:MAG: chromosome partitioning protein ParB, partial [Actinomycetota bacterium]|nr:chromosome partitioning protein ParB [Actinomycetota bacterium]